MQRFFSAHGGTLVRSVIIAASLSLSITGCGDDGGSGGDGGPGDGGMGGDAMLGGDSGTGGDDSGTGGDDGGTGGMDGGAGGDGGTGSGDGGTGSGDGGTGSGDGGTGSGDGGTGSGDGGTGGDGGMAGASCDGVEPTTVSNTVDNVITVSGGGFDSDASGQAIELRDADDTSADPVALSQVQVLDSTTAEGVLPEQTDSQGADQGLYNVVIVLSDGSELTCGSLQVNAIPPPTVTDVSPDTAWNGEEGDGVLSDRTVTILGQDFRRTPSVTFENRSTGEQFNALVVNFVSSTELSATVPSETLSMPVGDYDVFVTNPDGLRGQWLVPDGSGGMEPGTFRITGTPPPSIRGLDPFRGAAGQQVTVTIEGSDFQDGATVIFVNQDTGTEHTITMSASTNGDGNLEVTVSGGTLSSGENYTVKVINPDEQFDTHNSYSATSSAEAKLDQYDDSGVDMQIPRWRHDSEWGHDPFSNAYIFSAGGIDTDGNVLGSTEIMQVSDTTEPAQPRLSMQWGGSDDTPRDVNMLNTPRSSHVLVRSGRSLYAIGGAAGNTHTSSHDSVQLLDSIERARVLDYDERPRIQLPNAMGGSGLPIGTWYWQVSAIGPWGESLGSREVQVRNEGGQVEICWAHKTGVSTWNGADAAAYNLYRSLSSDGRAGTARLLQGSISASEANCTDDGQCCITDTGRGEYQPAPGRLRGSLVSPDSGDSSLQAGTYGYRVAALIDQDGDGTREFETLPGYRTYVTIEQADVDSGTNAIELRWDPVPGANYRIYRTDGPIPGDSPTGEEQTWLLTEVVDGTDGSEDGDVPEVLVDTGMSLQTNGDGEPVPPRWEPRPLAAGSISQWQTMGQTLTTPREGADGLVLTVPEVADDGTELGNHTYVYITGGRNGTAASDPYLRSTEFAEIFSDGTLGAFEISRDTGGDPVELTSPRAFFALNTNIGQREANRPPPAEEPPCTDFDGDGFLPESCGGMDCDDTDAGINPDADEICGDGIDQNCDGMDEMCADECPIDMDGDGEQPPECGGCDCADDNPDRYCGNTEICGDGIDQDCDGNDPACDTTCDMPDQDEDTYEREECGGCDCNDSNPDIHCGVEETCADNPGLCDDGIDQDCDGSDCTCVILYSDDSYDGSGLGSWAYESLPSFESLPPIEEERSYATIDTPWSTPYFGEGHTANTHGGRQHLLVASLGDDQYSGSGNRGLTTFEITRISTAEGDRNGHILGWTEQTVEVNGARQALGNEALIYFDVLWPYHGVSQEDRSAPSITQGDPALSRFLFDETASGSDYMEGTQSSAGKLNTTRAYYSLIRVNGGVFAHGGWNNDISGPVANIDVAIP